MNPFALLRNALAFTAVAVLVTPWLERAAQGQALPPESQAPDDLSDTNPGSTETRPYSGNGNAQLQ